MYRIPPNTTAWLQPRDVLLFVPAKQNVRHQHKLDRQSDTPSILQRTCQQFSEALNAMSNSAAKRTWDRLRTYTPEQLRHKSSSSTLKHCLLDMMAHNRSLYLYYL